jgi:hypothetical protein
LYPILLVPPFCVLASFAFDSLIPDSMASRTPQGNAIDTETKCFAPGAPHDFPGRFRRERGDTDAIHGVPEVHAGGVENGADVAVRRMWCALTAATARS